MVLLDQRAVKKTLKLVGEMKMAFDHVFFGQNHSKIVLVKNECWQVAVVTSQNQTYGDRAESSIITTDSGVFDVIMRQFVELAGRNSVEFIINDNDETEGFERLLYGHHHIGGTAPRHGGDGDKSGTSCDASPDTGTDWEPFGV